MCLDNQIFNQKPIWQSVPLLQGGGGVLILLDQSHNQLPWGFSAFLKPKYTVIIKRLLYPLKVLSPFPEMHDESANPRKIFVMTVVKFHLIRKSQFGEVHGTKTVDEWRYSTLKKWQWSLVESNPTS